MASRGVVFDQVWPSIADAQHGIVARRQLISAGLTPGVARREIISRRWRRLHAGVYATFTGPVPEPAEAWAAVLRGGPGAAAGHRTALWLWGVIDRKPDLIEVAIPQERRVVGEAGLRLHRMRGLAELVHPVATPPRLRLEPALLAATGSMSRSSAVVDLVLRATQRRLTTAPRLLTALRSWPRHRWRALMIAILAEVEEGVASPLELRYLRDVERAHGLPRGQRNIADKRTPGGGSRYRDVRYARHSTVVELDGKEAHPLDEAFRDLHRDNQLVTAGERPLRYGWRDVTGRPCEVAAQVGAVLRTQGWTADLTPCGPRCLLPSQKDRGRSG